MQANRFKAALAAGQPQIGFWLGSADPYVAEIFASVGYDWLLIDGEHGPNDVRSTLAQLQAVAAHASQPVVRPVKGDAAVIKQMLDIGTQNLLIPMIDTAEQAQQMVAATRYPPLGQRGVGTALARAALWKQIPDYLQQANDNICLLLQAESVTAMENLDAIAAIDGVDGIFFGPADLAASMGYIHEPDNPVVLQAIETGIKQVLANGKAVGILAVNEKLAKHYLALGASFVAVAVDTLTMVTAAKEILNKYR